MSRYVELPEDARLIERLGRVNSSDAADMLREVKSGEAAGRRNLRVRLVLERLTGGKVDDSDWTTKAMRRGVELEPEALAVYEALTGNLTDKPGYLQSQLLMAGATPDGVVRDDKGRIVGIVEVKNPLAANHLEYIKKGKVPRDYQSQVVHQMWVTGAKWGDFMSYFPRLEPPLDTFYYRFEWDDEAMFAYGQKLEEFLGEVDAEEAALRSLSYGEAQVQVGT